METSGKSIDIPRQEQPKPNNTVHLTSPPDQRVPAFGYGQTGEQKMSHLRASLLQTSQLPRLIVKPRQLTRQDIEELHPFGKIQHEEFVLDRSSRGYRLKNPVKIPLKHIYAAGSKRLAEYVMASLSSERPRLIPYVFRNQSLLKLARYLLRYKSSSFKTLYLYVDCIWRYTNRAGLSPDNLISDVKDENGFPRLDRLPYHVKGLEDYVYELQDRGLAPSRICNYVKAIRALYRVNEVDVKLPQPLSRRTVRRDRAPKPEELQRLINIADLRERVIVSMLALGGFREGTLVKLKHGHVCEELERGIIPLHIHVEAAITKGKYHDYDTFLGKEAIGYLREYLETRRLGSPNHKIPPENPPMLKPHDFSPVIFSTIGGSRPKSVTGTRSGSPNSMAVKKRFLCDQDNFIPHQ